MFAKHEEYLRENKIDHFDPMKTQKWHYQFPLDSLEDIQPSPMPQKPQALHSASLQGLMSIGNEKIAEFVHKFKKSC